MSPSIIADFLEGRAVMEQWLGLFILAAIGVGASGNYYIEELNKCEAVITSVKLKDQPFDEDSDEERHTYSIFVLAADKEQLVLSVSGSDGNGCYGTGYRLEVRV